MSSNQLNYKKNEVTANCSYRKRNKDDEEEN